MTQCNFATGRKILKNNPKNQTGDLDRYTDRYSVSVCVCGSGVCRHVKHEYFDNTGNTQYAVTLSAFNIR